MVALKTEMLLQGLLLGLQASLGQAQVIQKLVHPACVCLHHLTQGVLILVPSITGDVRSARCQDSPSQLPPVPQPSSPWVLISSLDQHSLRWIM